MLLEIKGVENMTTVVITAASLFSSYHRWAIPFNTFSPLFCKRITSLCFFANKRTNDKLPLHEEQTVNGLRKMAWASVFCFLFETADIDIYRDINYRYRYRYIFIYIYIYAASSIYIRVYMFIYGRRN
jgi:hypothetical protein